MIIEYSFNKLFKQVEFNIRNIGNFSDSLWGLYKISNVMCNNCGNKDHIHKYWRSKENGYSGNPFKKSTDYNPKWVTKKCFVSDTKYLKIATTTLNSNKYKWCTYWNNVNDAWGFHWKYSHNECFKRSKPVRSMFTFLIMTPIQ